VSGTAGAAAPILVMDTATSLVVIALGGADGTLRIEDSWSAGHRHSEELLPHLRDLLSRAGTRLADVSAIVVGTGPGTFTGLRVGLATAKALAVSLGCPIVGVPTAAALVDADRAACWVARNAGADEPNGGDEPNGAGGPGDAGESLGRSAAVLVPAGPSDRVLFRDGVATLVPAGTEPQDVAADGLIAVDLDGRAAPEASARGRAALDGLAAGLLRIGARRLADGDVDDVARLVPEYVTLPRGIREEHGAVEWSHSPR